MTASPLDLLAHELRSPVAALAAIAEAYADADGATRSRLVELARASGASIDALLAGGALATAPIRVDVGALAREVAESASVRGLRVVADAGPGLAVLGRPARLRQALDNLVANAVGHAPEGSPVVIGVRRSGGSVVVEVRDEGEGIGPDDRDRIFEPGVRLTSARPGSGLGLAVVQEVVREHGGEVSVESSPGRGSTFRLVLPGASAAP